MYSEVFEYSTGNWQCRALICVKPYKQYEECETRHWVTYFAWQIKFPKRPTFNDSINLLQTKFNGINIFKKFII